MSAPLDIGRLETLAHAAGRAIMAHRAAGVGVADKSDGSPVTAADRDAEAIILDGLRRSWPDIPCVGEEEVSAGIRTAPGRRFFLVDPLDGTREFIAGRAEFTVNIALVEDGVPVAGVVVAPALGLAFAAADGVAWRCDGMDEAAHGTRVPVRTSPRSGRLRIVASRSHRDAETDRFIARFPEHELIVAGSSLKFCLLADGKADLYPRFSRTMEWDTAAGDAVLRAAGGMTVTVDGRPLSYGKISQDADADFANPHFIATTGPVGDVLSAV